MPDELLDGFIAESKDQIVDRMVELYGTKNDVIKRGKKIRGSIILLISKAMGGNEKKALDFACAIEYIHAGSLVQDDVIDEHTERGGMTPMYLLVGAKKAVLTADKMFMIAQKIGAVNGGETSFEVADAMERTVEGAIKEINLDSAVNDLLIGKFEDNLYNKIIELKTASLFRACGRLGAMTFTKDERIINRFGEYGSGIGMAYQISDDLVDIVKLGSGGLQVTGLNVMQLLPTIVHYNKEVITRLPFMIMGGKINPMMLMNIMSDMNLSGKMKADIVKILKQTSGEIEDYVANSPERPTTELKTMEDFKYAMSLYPKYCVNKILEEAGEKI